jgi:hypothetical protein
MVWKYLFLWQFGQPAAGDTGGKSNDEYPGHGPDSCAQQFFPKGMQRIFIGLYIQQVCMAALFFLTRDQNGKASVLPQGVLMIVLIVLTVSPTTLVFRLGLTRFLGRI